MEAALLTLINNANTNLNLAIYGLNRQSVIDALITAHNRGVMVRVVGDDEAATASYQPYYQIAYRRRNPNRNRHDPFHHSAQ